MKILGIDPGTATTGYGIIDALSPSQFILEDFGLITTSKDLPHGARLDLIFSGISSLIEKHRPEVVSIERLFFATNALTAIAVGQAIGVIKLAIHRQGLLAVDYTPMQVKLYIGGNGRADKQVIKAAVKKLLKIKGHRLTEFKDGGDSTHKVNKSHFDDAADALALAICHAQKLLAPPPAPRPRKLKVQVK